MHFAKERKFQKTGLRVLSFALCFLLVCSVLVTGYSVDLQVSADSVSVSAGSTIYVDISAATWYCSDDENPAAAWCYVGDDGGKLVNLVHVDGNIWSFTVEDDCDRFKLLRYETAMGFNESGYPKHVYTENSTDDITLMAIYNCVKMSNNGQSYEWTTYGDVKLPSGQRYPVAVGYKNAAFEDGYGYIDGGEEIELYPVKATFYDYLTDYEIYNGWRSNRNDYWASRDYMNRVPFSMFNKYISKIVADSGQKWSYPLYFGNFYSHWTGFDSFPYGTLKDYCMYDADHNQYPYAPHLSEGMSRTYTDGKDLLNFSIYANDSAPASTRIEGGVREGRQGSVQGLVKDTLVDGKLMMTTSDNAGIESPYFSDQTVADGYANKVTTKFPMRVKDDNEATSIKDGSTVYYTTYEFYSGHTRDDVTSDNVYFTYNDGVPVAINYGRGADYELYDAWQSLGSNPYNHRGFFPFDNNGNTIDGNNNVAYDYGFGMRLDIPFNLTKDGLIKGTSESMKFTFEGDDDVWVFVDGKLVLDLGGDHTNAKGEVDFYSQKSTVSTGVVSLSASPTYGSTEYVDASERIETDISSIITKNSSGEYDVSKLHTLTVFYMERGLIESNLKLSFSISPLGNELTVDNTIDCDGVNDKLRSRVEEAVKNEDFTFNVDASGVDDIESEYEYNKGDEEDIPLGDGASVKHNELIEFVDQITDDANLTIIETPASDNKYKYSTSYTVIDNLMNDRNEPGATVKDNVSADTSQDNDNRSVTFDFTTNSTASVIYNSFAVSAVNKIDVGSFTLTKALVNTANGAVTGDSTEFNFDVYVKLPGENSYQATPEFTNQTITAGNSFTIDGLPIGSKVKVKEKGAQGYNSATDEGTEYEITNSLTPTTVTYTNTKLDLPTVTLSAKKQIDGADMNNSSERFTFKLVSEDDKTNVNQSAENDANGNITFDPVVLNGTGTYWFSIKEDTTVNSEKYLLDTTSYYAKVTVTWNQASYVVTTEYYTDKNGTNSTNAVVFNNTTIEQKGSLIITKAGENGADLSGTTFAIYKVSAEGSVPTTDPTATKTVDGNYKATFTDLEAGWYAIKETVAPKGHELEDGYKYVEVVASETPTTFTFTDRASTKLPKTGGIGAVGCVVVGMILVIVGLALLKTTKKESFNDTQD